MSFINKAGAVFAATAIALTGTGCSRTDVAQNEIAARTDNGVITEDHLSPGGHWLGWSIFTDKQILAITRATQNATITVTDGQKCDKDCIPVLQTNNQQTVSGSLTAQWEIKADDTSKQSPMAQLYLLRGATSTDDVTEKLIMPVFRDCVIASVRSRSSFEVNDQGPAVVAEVQTCLQDGMKNLPITVLKVFDNGFGPSPEAREAMKRFINARQEGQIADANIANRDKRKDAAVASADAYGAAYMEYKKLGVPDEQIPEVMCLNDPNNAGRPCIRGTANGPAAPAAK